MHVLAFVNQKGGCGKTTTAVNLAGALAARGARVLLVDMDPQGHATMALGHAPTDEPTLLDVLERAQRIDTAIVEAAGGVALVPATERLVEFEESAARSLHAESRLVRALQRMERTFDYVILDCPPRTEGILAANALRATDTAVLVIEAGAFALQGAIRARTLLEDKLRAEKSRARADGEPLPEDAFALRAVGTMFDKRARIARELLIGIHARFGGMLFDTAIRTSVRLREAAALGVTIQSLDRRGGAAQDFAALAIEVEAHARDVTERRARAERASAERRNTDRVYAGRMDADRVNAGPMVADRVNAGQMDTDRVNAGRMDTDRVNASPMVAARVNAGRRMDADDRNASRSSPDRVATESMWAEPAETPSSRATPPRADEVDVAVTLG